MAVQAKKSEKSALHFKTASYPRFGKAKYSEENPPETVKSSPFFWWFKFLQLNEDYQRTERNNGKGVCAELFKDFGSVGNTDFKTWWKAHAQLFADEKASYSLRVAQSAEELAPLNSTEAVNIVVPLDWSQKSLKKRFAMALDQLGVEKGKKGPVTQNLSAKYSVGRRWNCGAMESAYKVYMIRQMHLGKGAKETKKMQHKGLESKKFKFAWADVAIAAKLRIAVRVKYDKVLGGDAVTRRQLTIAAIRHYKKAALFIKAAATS